eukprot:2397173-Pyramimonas_sp.AAC.1
MTGLAPSTAGYAVPLGARTLPTTGSGRRASSWMRGARNQPPSSWSLIWYAMTMAMVSFQQQTTAAPQPTAQFVAAASSSSLVLIPACPSWTPRSMA